MSYQGSYLASRAAKYGAGFPSFAPETIERAKFRTQASFFIDAEEANSDTAITNLGLTSSVSSTLLAKIRNDPTTGRWGFTDLDANNVNNWHAFPDSADWDPAQMTVYVFNRRRTTGVAQALVAHRNTLTSSSTSAGWAISRTSTGALQFALGDLTVGNSIIGTAQDASLLPFVEVGVLDRSLNQLRAYREGAPVNTPTNLTASGYNSSTSLWVGRLSTGGQFDNGFIYRVAIFPSVHSDADILKFSDLLKGDRYYHGQYWVVSGTSGDTRFHGYKLRDGDIIFAYHPDEDPDDPMLANEVNWVVQHVPSLTEKFGSPADATPFEESVIHPYRRVDIFESDGVTPWRQNAPVVSGSVQVDYNRDERRQGDLVLSAIEGIHIDAADGIWYDKIIKVYRGLWFDDDAEFWQIGEFLIDRLSYNREGNIKVTMRDMTKRMMNTKFARTTSFAQGTEVSIIIKALAANSGITKMNVPVTTKTTGKIFTFERGASRWEAAKEVANAYGFELYFNARGYLTMREWVDPLTAPISLVLVANYSGEAPDGTPSNVTEFDKSLSDARMYNHVVVTGEAADVVLAFAEVRNSDPGSLTNVNRIGERTYTYTSQFITDNTQALDTANKFLKIHALEQFEINVGSAVYPWLEVGEAIQFQDDSHLSVGPDRFLFTSFTIPLSLGDMDISGSRVGLVGSYTQEERVIFGGSEERITRDGEVRTVYST